MFKMEAIQDGTIRNWILLKGVKLTDFNLECHSPEIAKELCRLINGVELEKLEQENKELREQNEGLKDIIEIKQVKITDLLIELEKQEQSSQECPKEKCGKYGKYDMMDGVAIPRCIGDCKRYVQSDNFEPVSPVNLESKKEE